MNPIENNPDWKVCTFHNKNITPKTYELCKKQDLLGKFKNRDNQIKHQKLDKHEESFELPKPEISFGKLMQKARLNLKMSQKDLANKLNVKENFISDYESCKLPQDKLFESKIRKILNIAKSI
jgi:ribosome-binding protein aMBF1 (putative translation factor)